MSVKTINYDSKITREVKRTVTSPQGGTFTVTDSYAHTDFIADSVSDITAMNAAGSEYLNYPAGSAALCLEDGNVYILNASETAYEIPGGANNA